MFCLGKNELWGWFFCCFFFKPLLRIPRHSEGWLRPFCWMSGNPGCVPCVHWSPLQPVWSEPSTPGRYQPYSTWDKAKICPCLGSWMHPGAEISLHMCIFAFGAGQTNSPDTKSRVKMSAALESDSLLCLTHWILTTRFSLLCFFSPWYLQSVYTMGSAEKVCSLV